VRVERKRELTLSVEAAAPEATAKTNKSATARTASASSQRIENKFLFPMWVPIGSRDVCSISWRDSVLQKKNDDLFSRAVDPFMAGTVPRASTQPHSAGY